jgi:hypothetical protein
MANGWKEDEYTDGVFPIFRSGFCDSISSALEVA